jgi:hypothetical protein
MESFDPVINHDIIITGVVILRAEIFAIWDLIQRRKLIKLI